MHCLLFISRTLQRSRFSPSWTDLLIYWSVESRMSNHTGANDFASIFQSEPLKLFQSQWLDKRQCNGGAFPWHYHYLKNGQMEGCLYFCLWWTFIGIMHSPAPYPHHHHHQPDPNSMLSLSLKLSLNCQTVQQQHNFEDQPKYLYFADKLFILGLICYTCRDIAKHTPCQLAEWLGRARTRWETTWRAWSWKRIEWIFLPRP